MTVPGNEPRLALGAIRLVFIVVVGRNIGDAYPAPVDLLPAAGLGLALGLVLGGAFDMTALLLGRRLLPADATAS